MLSRWMAFWQRINAPLLSIAAVVLIGLVYFLGVESERSGFVREVIDPGFRKLSDPVLNAFRAKPPAIAQLKIQLDIVAFDSLMVLSMEAFREGHLDGTGNSVFAGTLLKGDLSVPIVVGLLEGDEREGSRMWPIHVRALPGDTILGMQTFDVLPVLDETPLWSIVLNAVLKEFGHPTLGDVLSEVDLNDQEMGLCVLQGRTDATMLGQWSNGNGPVLRFDDSMVRASKVDMAQRIFSSTPPPQGDWASAPLLMRAGEEILPTRRARHAIDRLEAFRGGILSAAEVFDVETVARLLAVCDLLGTQSAMDWWDLQFLVDSTSGKLVPVAPHLRTNAPITSLQGAMVVGNELLAIQGRELAIHFLSDTTIQRHYLAYLDTFSTAGYWQNLMARTEDQWEPARKVVHAEYPRLDLDTMILVHDRTVIYQTLHPSDMVLAYMRDSQFGGSSVAIANVHSLPVEIIALVYSNLDTVYLDAPIRLAAHLKDRPLTYGTVPIMDYRRAEKPSAILARLSPGLTVRKVPIRMWTTLGAN